MTHNLRRLPSGAAVLNTSTGEWWGIPEGDEADVEAWKAWAATLPPLEANATHSHANHHWSLAMLDEIRNACAGKAGETTAAAARRVVSERDALKRDVIRVGEACEEAKRQIIEATKAADKACEERDEQGREVLRLERLIDSIAALLGRRAPKETTYEAARRVVEELSTLRAQRERMPAKLVEAAKSYLSSFGDRYLAIHGFGLAGEILRDLAACEPAAMLTVEAAVRVVHDVKRVIVRGTPIPNTVDTFDVEEALRKAAKS